MISTEKLSNQELQDMNQKVCNNSVILNTPIDDVETVMQSLNNEELQAFNKQKFEQESEQSQKNSKGKLDQQESENIQVMIKIRSLNDKEKGEGAENCIQSKDQTIILYDREFQFDQIADQDVSQNDMLEMVGKPVIDQVFEGYNATIFAYGQTGAGKTYSMQGKQEIEEYGLIQNSLKYLYDLLNDTTSNYKIISSSISSSYFEIYNEQIYDLLSPALKNSKGLNIREDVTRGVYIDNLLEVETLNLQENLQIMRQGSQNRFIFFINLTLPHRHTSQTMMNINSSRSHTIFQINISIQKEQQDCVKYINSKLFFIDLAGSERQQFTRKYHLHNQRQKQTNASGDRLKEAQVINKSLSTLGQVINNLSLISQGKNRHVPYRDSKLTHILKDSLGGNCKTYLIAAISPASSQYQHTLSTLQFAQRTKEIKVKSTKNEKTFKSIAEYQEEISYLQLKLQKQQEQIDQFEMMQDTTIQINLENSRLQEQIYKFQDLENSLKFNIQEKSSEFYSIEIENTQLKKQISHLQSENDVFKQQFDNQLSFLKQKNQEDQQTIEAQQNQIHDLVLYINCCKNEIFQIKDKLQNNQDFITGNKAKSIVSMSNLFYYNQYFIQLGYDSIKENIFSQFSSGNQSLTSAQSAIKQLDESLISLKEEIHRFVNQKSQQHTIHIDKSDNLNLFPQLEEKIKFLTLQNQQVSLQKNQIISQKNNEILSQMVQFNKIIKENQTKYQENYQESQLKNHEFLESIRLNYENNLNIIQQENEQTLKSLKEMLETKNSQIQQLEKQNKEYPSVLKQKEERIKELTFQRLFNEMNERNEDENDSDIPQIPIDMNQHSQQKKLNQPNFDLNSGVRMAFREDKNLSNIENRCSSKKSLNPVSNSNQISTRDNNKRSATKTNNNNNNQANLQNIDPQKSLNGGSNSAIKYNLRKSSQSAQKIDTRQTNRSKSTPRNQQLNLHTIKAQNNKRNHPNKGKGSCTRRMAAQINENDVKEETDEVFDYNQQIEMVGCLEEQEALQMKLDLNKIYNSTNQERTSLFSKNKRLRNNKDSATKGSQKANNHQILISDSEDEPKIRKKLQR